MRIPSYATLLGEYSGVLKGLIEFHGDKFPEDVLSNIKKLLRRLESITDEDIVRYTNNTNGEYQK